MVILSLFYWWYTTGWLTLLRKTGEKIKSALNFFSVPLLAASLFAPFRQISAGRVQGPLGVQMRAWADRTFSRFMGAIFRTIIIIIGIVTVVIIGAFGLIAVCAWPILPLAPLFLMILIPGVTA